MRCCEECYLGTAMPKRDTLEWNCGIPNLVMFSYSHTSGPKAVVAYEKEFMTPCTDVYRSPQSLMIIALCPDATRHQSKGQQAWGRETWYAVNMT